MKIAVLYQAAEPPVIDGIRKPMKEGGYSDSGADIAYCLKTNGIEVITPVAEPRAEQNFDWVFPDTYEGIEKAVSMGADTLWLNTVLFNGHPIEKFHGIGIIGQTPSDVELLDNKAETNERLIRRGLKIAEHTILKNAEEYKGKFPGVLKPIRGRGSQGVKKCTDMPELVRELDKALSSGRFGNRMMLEPYLEGEEITVTVFPDGETLPIVRRFNHKEGIAPYNGVVAVSQNSSAVDVMNEELELIERECARVAKELKPKGVLRIDCRADGEGHYYMFDINPKPNMTGEGRPSREGEDSLVMIGAKKKGMTYFDLLSRFMDFRWIME